MLMYAGAVFTDIITGHLRVSSIIRASQPTNLNDSTPRRFNRVQQCGWVCECLFHEEMNFLKINLFPLFSRN